MMRKKPKCPFLLLLLPLLEIGDDLLLRLLLRDLAASGQHGLKAYFQTTTTMRWKTRLVRLFFPPHV